MGHHYSKTSSNPTLKGNTTTTTNQNTAKYTINNINCNPTATTITTDSAATVVTVEEPQNNRIPISPVINLQFEKSPATSSHARLSTSSSSSLTSVNTICGKQIIIKIQLAKMENGNGNEQQKQVEQQQQHPVLAQVQSQAQIQTQTQNMPEFVELDANSNQFLNGFDDQTLNVTLNRNFICGDDMSSVLRSPSSSSSTEVMNRTAGSIASSMMPTRNNRNSCTTTATTLHMERLNALQLDDELLKQGASEYCDFVCAGSSRQMQATASAAAVDDEEFVLCEVRDADNNNCCQQLNKSKTTSTESSHSATKTPPHRTSSKFTYRDAFRRILEPSSSKSNKNKERKDNSNKQQKQTQQHSNNSSVAKTCPHHHQIQVQQQHQETQRNSNNHLILQYPPSASNTNSNQQPISITATSSSATPGTVVAPAFSNNSNSMSTNPQLSIWSSNDVILPFNSPQVFVVCPSTSRVTLGHINDNAAIRVTTEILGGGGGGVCSNSASQCDSVSDTALINSITTQSSHHHGPIAHSQVDFMHCLVPDLERIINSSFYWGKMDRYEAERLLEGKPEGTFLLRDSAQEEFLFSVTFRKYGRSLHARIEQRAHRFSFDCHDPCVFTASTVTGLLEHYKDPACVMFFEPMLTIPFHRKMVFSLQQLARATIVSSSTYDGINQLELPKRLKAYLKEYHYKRKLRVKPFAYDSRLQRVRYLCT